MRYHTSKSGDEMISFKVPAVLTGCFHFRDARGCACHGLAMCSQSRFYLYSPARPGIH